MQLGQVLQKFDNFSPVASTKLETSHVEAVALVQCNKSEQKVFLGNGSRRLEFIQSAEIQHDAFVQVAAWIFVN